MSTSNAIPILGFSDIINLTNSSRTRSAEMISIRPAISLIAAITVGSTSKPSCDANLAARIIRSGSSENEFSGVPGVRKTLRTKSLTPSKLSINVGGVVVSSRAMAFTVKSLRNKSPSILSPKFTSGFRLWVSYFSLR